MKRANRQVEIRGGKSSAFTLVELLVVITIIGILIALLLPAVQAAREAARMAQCENNLKQLALGCLNHESATQRFPTNGWGFDWIGDPDFGNDWRQPGGWLYNVLPYIEQQPLHDLGIGLPWNDTTKEQLNLQRIGTPIVTFYCPTRRRAATYPLVPSTTNWGSGAPVNCPVSTSTILARNDYAVNGGDIWTFSGYGLNYSFPPPWGDACGWGGGGPSSPWNVMDSSTKQMTAAGKTVFSNVAHQATGVSYCGSVIRLSDITDGATNTYLCGEKYVNPDCYLTGADGADNESAFIGDDDDIIRWAFAGSPTTNPYPPMPDTPGYGAGPGFGGAHLAGFNMAFCDGSVHTLNFSIDFLIHCQLCNRKDGSAIDGKKY